MTACLRFPGDIHHYNGCPLPATPPAETQWENVPFWDMEVPSSPEPQTSGQTPVRESEYVIRHTKGKNMQWRGAIVSFRVHSENLRFAVGFSYSPYNYGRPGWQT